MTSEPEAWWIRMCPISVSRNPATVRIRPAPVLYCYVVAMLISIALRRFGVL